MTLARVARAECRRCCDFPKKALLGKLTHLERCALLPFSGLDPENRQVGGSSRCYPVSLKKEKQKDSLGPEAATPAPGSDFSFMRELLPNTHIFKPQPLGHGWHEWISTLGSSLSFQLLHHYFSVLTQEATKQSCISDSYPGLQGCLTWRSVSSTPPREDLPSRVIIPSAQAFSIVKDVGYGIRLSGSTSYYLWEREQLIEAKKVFTLLQGKKL